MKRNYHLIDKTKFLIYLSDCQIRFIQFKISCIQIRVNIWLTGLTSLNLWKIEYQKEVSLNNLNSNLSNRKHEYCNSMIDCTTTSVILSRFCDLISEPTALDILNSKMCWTFLLSFYYLFSTLCLTCKRMIMLMISNFRRTILVNVLYLLHLVSLMK